ncbi:hypothetical protein AB0F11_23990 [Streptomyces sp. NPDC032472]|uniref:hypothetical protein n=1 Tax=Streptomyces sp. NPDC032472 TaxID=3155018 RepID=UPI0033C1DF23
MPSPAGPPLDESLHHIRVVTFAKDASRLRANIASALRHNARDARRPLALLGLS